MDSIEIICEHCKTKNFLEFEKSETDISINCVKCSSVIYWHVCSKCETGFYSMEKDFKCPDCSPEDNNEVKKVKSSSLIKKECPWCGESVGILSIVFSKQTLGQCKSCKKYYKAGNQFSSLLIYVVYLLGIAVIGKGYIMNLQSEPLKTAIALLLVISGFIIYLKVLRLERYNY